MHVLVGVGVGYGVTRWPPTLIIADAPARREQEEEKENIRMIYDRHTMSSSLLSSSLLRCVSRFWLLLLLIFSLSPSSSSSSSSSSIVSFCLENHLIWKFIDEATDFELKEGRTNERTEGKQHATTSAAAAVNVVNDLQLLLLL